jgi:hypothetical protein
MGAIASAPGKPAARAPLKERHGLSSLICSPRPRGVPQPRGADRTLLLRADGMVGRRVQCVRNLAVDARPRLPSWSELAAMERRESRASMANSAASRPMLAAAAHPRDRERLRSRP